MGVAGVLALSVWVQPSSALVPSSRVVGLQNIGGLTLDASYADAINHFGSVGIAGSSASFDKGECIVEYPKLGLTLWYLQNDLLVKGASGSCLYFQEGVATGAGWHTANVHR